MLKNILFIDNRESQCTKKDDADMAIESLNSFLYQSGLTQECLNIPTAQNDQRLMDFLLLHNLSLYNLFIDYSHHKTFQPYSVSSGSRRKKSVVMTLNGSR